MKFKIHLKDPDGFAFGIRHALEMETLATQDLTDEERLVLTHQAFGNVRAATKAGVLTISSPASNKPDSGSPTPFQ